MRALAKTGCGPQGPFWAICGAWAVFGLAACADPATAQADAQTTESDASGDAGDPGQDAASDTVAGADTAIRPDLTWPPEKAGPYGVGYRNEALTFVTTPEGATRTILLNVWYPTQDTTGTPAVYFEGYPVPYEDVFAGAKLAPPVDPAGYPVHLFTHGHLGFGGSAPLMARHFASHGWVVIAPDHTGNTTIDNSGPKPPQIYWWRQMDDVASLDWLANLKAPDPLAGLARVDRTFLSGHSFGSTDVWAMTGVDYDVGHIAAKCKEATSEADCSAGAMAKYAGFHGDKRIVGAAILAGGVDGNVYLPTAPTRESLPMLIMTGTADQGHPHAPLWDPLPHGWWVDIAGGCHQTFGLGSCDAPMTEEVGPPIVWTYTLALARKTVLSDAGPDITAILDGSRVVSTYATLQKK